MTIVKLKNIDRFRDRHGRWRYYYRIGQGVRFPLPGLPGSPEFMGAYEVASRGEPVTSQRKLRGSPGTFDRLTQDYFTSSDFLRLAVLSDDLSFGHRAPCTGRADRPSAGAGDAP